MTQSFWYRLFHRWFVEYNPLYLVSAACVLVGVNQLSGALSDSSYRMLAVAGIAELYAWALIASAAFLIRIRLKRPAVMLALLTALYQCDPTLHTETCAYLGGAGFIASALWLSSFAAKLYGLAWALELRLSRSAKAVPLFGAAGLSLLPFAIQKLSAHSASALTALWLFGTFSAALWASRSVTSKEWLNAWGRTVLRRSVMSVWALWAVLLLSHVWFWIREFNLEVAPFLPIPLLLSVRWAEGERGVWSATGAALLLASLSPASFSITATMAAVTLGLRALRHASSTAERTRLVVGSVYGLYLAAWTLSWTRGALPPHQLALDALLCFGLGLMTWRLRPRAAAVVPLIATLTHLGVELGIISAPTSQLTWGLALVTLRVLPAARLARCERSAPPPASATVHRRGGGRLSAGAQSFFGAAASSRDTSRTAPCAALVASAA